MIGPVLSIHSFFGEAGVTWLDQWLPLSIITVLISMIFLSTIFILGRAFSIRKLEMFAKSEILQTAATAFMVIFFVAMVDSAFLIAQEIIRGEVACGTEPIFIGEAYAKTTMDDAYDAIRCRLQERATEVAAVQDNINNNAAGDFYSLTSRVSLLGITIWQGDWSDTIFTRTETMRIVNNLATTLLIGLNAQSALIEYLKINMLHIFIPVGLLLRSFYFTRGPGALLISVGVGMYFVFPVFFVLLDPGFVSIPLPPPPPTTTTPFCYGTMSNAVTVLTSVEETGIGSTIGLSFANMRDNLSKTYVMLLIHPLVALFLTLVFIRYMMTLLGGDTYALTRMVTKVI